jgi:hypothetical protein
MTVPAALFLLASTAPALLFDRVLPLRPAEIKPIPFSVKVRPATVEFDFRTSKPEATVRLLVLPKSEEFKLQAKRDYREVAVSEFLSAGQLKTHIPSPGEYLLVIDNRHNAHVEMRVQVKCWIAYDTATATATYLSPARRLALISASLILFFSISWFAGRRLWSAILAQKRPAPPQPYV